MERKTFIKTCGYACIGSVFTSALFEGCSSANYYAASSVVNQQIVVKKAAFINNEKGGPKLRKFILLKTESLYFPICLYKTNEEYSALFMSCTHKGCELQPHGNYLICPCHGSEFSNKGIVQNPPAEENLRIFQIKTDDENIYIQL